MHKLKALYFTAVWAKELLKLAVHYGVVWEPGSGRLHATREELQDFDERMRTGPLHMEYQRVEAIKNKAIALWRA